MFDQITLGVSGDTNLIKTRLFNHPECVFPISMTKNPPEEGLTYITFNPTDDLFVLDQYVGVVAEYIIDRYEAKLIRRILKEDYPLLSPVQTREILKNIECFTDDAEIGYKARKQCIILSIYDYLKEDKTMLIDGFVNFRLKEYESLLNHLTRLLVEHYMTQKEYEEFIGLLKYFVNIQTPRPELIHICVGALGGYTILNDKEEDITTRCFSEFAEDGLFSEEAYDDLLISVLITLAPQEIVVHGSPNIRNQELFSTISRVFDGKLQYCFGCKLCATP